MKEVVAQTDPLELEQLRPDAGENALRLSARHILCLFSVINRKVGGRQRAAINLAVWRYWYGIEKDESRRNHLLRQTLCQELTQLLRSQLVIFDDYIRY
jgi:hypothetical protein